MPLMPCSGEMANGVVRGKTEPATYVGEWIAVGAERCPDCAAAPGAPHIQGCDVARCKECGEQAIQCFEHADAPSTVWTGSWPGNSECVALGLWCRWTPPAGWVPCRSTDADAQPDLNALTQLAATGTLRWDRTSEQFVAA